MDQLSDLLASDPIYMAVAVVLALIILFGVIKKLLKLVLVVSALLVLWIAYSTWSGNDVSVKSLTDDLQSGVDAMKGKASEVTSIGDKNEKITNINLSDPNFNHSIVWAII